MGENTNAWFKFLTDVFLPFTALFAVFFGAQKSINNWIDSRRIHNKEFIEAVVDNRTQDLKKEIERVKEEAIKDRKFLLDFISTKFK